MSAHLEPEVLALVLAELGKRVKGEQDRVKAVFSGTYLAGTKQTFRTPSGDTLGYVQRTDPAPEWRVVDPDKLRAHLAAFPGCVQEVTSILVPGIGWHEVDALDEIVLILREHAPHLVQTEQEVTQEAIDAAVAAAPDEALTAADPAEPIPGVRRVRPGGVLRVVPAKDASTGIERMIRGGLLDWGQLALGAGPAETEAAS